MNRRHHEAELGYQSGRRELLEVERKIEASASRAIEVEKFFLLHAMSDALDLVGNAIKFTGPGEVGARAVSANGSFTVSVGNTGPGIDPADQARILQGIQQVDTSSIRKTRDTGLGLSISKRIVELYGERSWAESTLRRGSTFGLTSPVRVVRALESA
jgi:signal transduction histidine kinase